LRVSIETVFYKNELLRMSVHVLRTIELDTLEIFKAVVDCGGVTRAAAQLLEPRLFPRTQGYPRYLRSISSSICAKSPIETLAKRVGSFIAEWAKRWQTTELGKTEPRPADLESVRSLRLIK
jgi:hypothetical protein